MASKRLECNIGSCACCTYSSLEMAVSPNWAQCHKFSQPKVMTMVEYRNIPSWCPLPDSKDKETNGQETGT